jgi:hypothetical protein
VRATLAGSAGVGLRKSSRSRLLSWSHRHHLRTISVPLRSHSQRPFNVWISAPTAHADRERIMLSQRITHRPRSNRFNALRNCRRLPNLRSAASPSVMGIAGPSKSRSNPMPKYGDLGRNELDDARRRAETIGRIPWTSRYRNSTAWSLGSTTDPGVDELLSQSRRSVVVSRPRRILVEVRRKGSDYHKRVITLRFYRQCSGGKMLWDETRPRAGALPIECVELSRTGVYGD